MRGPVVFARVQREVPSWRVVAAFQNERDLQQSRTDMYLKRRLELHGNDRTRELP